MARHLSLIYNVQTSFGPTHSSIQMAFIAGLKLPIRKADHPTQSGAEVKNIWSHTSTLPIRFNDVYRKNVILIGSADKPLAQPGRKQATATKLGIYSTYSPRSSIHFLSRCSNFCKTLKKNSEYFPSNQVSVAAMTSAADEKWRSFNCFFF